MVKLVQERAAGIDSQKAGQSHEQKAGAISIGAPDKEGHTEY